jgi:hypothetical protein
LLRIADAAGDAGVLGGEHQRALAAFDAAFGRVDPLHNVRGTTLAALVPKSVTRHAARATLPFILLVAAFRVVVPVAPLSVFKIVAAIGQELACPGHKGLCRTRVAGHTYGDGRGQKERSSAK